MKSITPQRISNQLEPPITKNGELNRSIMPKITEPRIRKPPMRNFKKLILALSSMGIRSVSGVFVSVNHNY
jgi:hypothetical protein